MRKLSFEGLEVRELKTVEAGFDFTMETPTVEAEEKNACFPEDGVCTPPGGWIYYEVEDGTWPW